MKCIANFVLPFTDAIAFSGKTRVTNEDYIPEYSNKSSPEFQNFQKIFVSEVFSYTILNIKHN